MWPSAPCVLTTWTANLVCRLVYKKQMLLCASVVQWKKGNFMMDIFSCLKLLAQTLNISLCSDCLLWLLWFGFWKFDFNMLDDILRGISHNVSQKTVGRKFFVKICQSQGNKMIYNVTHFQSTSYQYAVEIWQSNLEMTALWDKQLNSTELQQSYQILLGTVIGKFFFFSNLTTLICQTFKYFSFSNKPMQHVVHQKGNFFSPFNP